MKQHFPEGDYKVETISPSVGENSSGRGRRPVRHLISLDMLEDLMMQAATEQGKNIEERPLNSRKDYATSRCVVSGSECEREEDSGMICAYAKSGKWYCSTIKPMK